MLQHRGQDSAGMVTTDGDCFHEHKENGLVRDVFGSQTIINTLQGLLPEKESKTFLTEKAGAFRFANLSLL